MSGDFYHMSQKAISAAKGQSAVAAAAYRHGAKMAGLRIQVTGADIAALC